MSPVRSSPDPETRCPAGPRPLLPHQRARERSALPHPTAAFPLMAPAAAQAPTPAPRAIEERIDALMAEAQAALDRMRARAIGIREALLEAREATVPPERTRFEVPTLTRVPQDGPVQGG